MSDVAELASLVLLDVDDPAPVVELVDAVPLLLSMLLVSVLDVVVPPVVIDVAPGAAVVDASDVPVAVLSPVLPPKDPSLVNPQASADVATTISCRRKRETTMRRG